MEQLELCGGEDNSTPINLPELPTYALLGNIQTVGSGNLVRKNVTSPTTETPETILSIQPEETQTKTEENSQTAVTENQETTEKSIEDIQETKIDANKPVV